GVAAATDQPGQPVLLWTIEVTDAEGETTRVDGSAATPATKQRRQKNAARTRKALFGQIGATEEQARGGGRQSRRDDVEMRRRRCFSRHRRCEPQSLDRRGLQNGYSE